MEEHPGPSSGRWERSSKYIVNKYFFCSRQDSQVTVQELKDILEQVDGMDQFQVVSELDRFFVQNVRRDELNHMKLQLRRVLLEEIIKVDNRNIYSERLQAIVKLLKHRSQLYGCCLIGCRFEGKGHRDYVKHIRTSHPHVSNVICNFKHKCVRSCLSIEALLVHIREDHSNVVGPTEIATQMNTAVLDIPVKCNMSSCGSKHFSSIKLLITHFNTFHLKDARNCVFAHCDHKFGPFQESRKHFRTKHIAKGLTNVKNQHHLTVPGLPDLAELPVLSDEDSISVQHSLDGPEQYENASDDEGYDAFQIDEIENCEPDDESEEYFLHYYADFLNRLSHVKFIPHSTVQEIADVYFKNSKRAQDIREKKLR